MNDEKLIKNVKFIEKWAMKQETMSDTLEVLFVYLTSMFVGVITHAEEHCDGIYKEKMKKWSLDQIMKLHEAVEIMTRDKKDDH